MTRGFSPTRGEPRPLSPGTPGHITLIATCRVYNSVVVTRRVTPRLSPGYENPTGRSINVLSSRGTWGGVCCALQPAQKHRGPGPLSGMRPATRGGLGELRRPQFRRSAAAAASAPRVAPRAAYCGRLYTNKQRRTHAHAAAWHRYTWARVSGALTPRDTPGATTLRRRLIL